MDETYKKKLEDKLAELKQEHVNLNYQAGDCQYQIFLLTETLSKLNLEIQKINQRGDALLKKLKGESDGTTASDQTAGQTTEGNDGATNGASVAAV